MGVTAIIHDDIAPGCTSITATNPNPDYPVTNLLTIYPADKYITTANTTEIIITYATAQVFESIALVAHNLPAAGASVKIYLTNNNFLNYILYEITSIHPETMIKCVQGNHNKVKLIIQSTGVISIGQLYIGSYTEISMLPESPIRRVPVETSIISKNDFGMKTKKVMPLIWQVQLKFSLVPVDEYTAIVLILHRNEAIVLIIDAETGESYQGAATAIPAADQDYTGTSFELSFEQNPYTYE